MNKYNNRKTEIDGIKFDSKKEADRYIHLKQLEKTGEIKNLDRQVRLNIIINDIKVCTYIADFKYEQDGRQIYEDVKGYKTDVYKLKKKLVMASLGINILEV